MKRNRKQHEKEWVFQFLVKYIMLSMFSILLVLSAIYLTVYRRLEIARVTDSSVKSIEQLSLSCDSLFDSIRELSFRIYNDESITYLVNGLNTDIEYAIKASNRLTSYGSMASGIASIYVYCRQTDCFYTTVSSAAREMRQTFFDSEAVGFIDNITLVRPLYPLSREITTPGVPEIAGNSTGVYTFLYYGMPVSSADMFKRVVMINVSRDWVNESIRLWDSYGEGDICILSDEGALVGGGVGGLDIYISREDFVSRILGAEEPSGYFMEETENEKIFVTYFYSADLRWYFVRVLPYASIYGNIKRIGLAAAVLLVLDLAVGSLLAYLITGKAKKSIDEIINGLKEQVEANRCDLDVLREEFLYDSLCGNTASTARSLRKDFARYGIGLPVDAEVTLALFKIDGYAGLCDRLRPCDISLLRQGVMRTAADVWGKYRLVEAADMKTDHVVLIFAAGSPPAEADRSVQAGLIRNVQELSLSRYDLSLSAVLGSPGYTFKDAGLLYDEVRQAAEYRIFRGRRCLIRAEELKVLPAQRYEYPWELEKKLLDALMLGRVEAAGKLLRSILDTASGYSCTVLHSLLLRLTCSIGGIFENIGQTGKFAIDYNFNTFLAVLNRCETVDEIYASFEDMFRHVFSVMEKKKNSRYERVVNKVAEIIHRDYADETLCLNGIAAMINLSPGYLGKIFKMYTTKSVADYINQVRMENAARLLTASGMSIGDISSRVGFSCSNYFYTVFRKNYGITPSEYRQQAKATTS